MVLLRYEKSRPKLVNLRQGAVASLVALNRSKQIDCEGDLEVGDDRKQTEEMEKIARDHVVPPFFKEE